MASANFDGCAPGPIRLRSDFGVISRSAECCFCPPIRRWFMTRRPGDHFRCFGTEIIIDQTPERGRSPRSYSRRSPDRTVIDVDAVLLRPDIREPSPETICMSPVHRRASTIQKARFSQHKRAAADRGDPPGCFGCLLHERDHGRIGRRHVHLGDRTHDNCVEGGIFRTPRFCSVIS